MANDIRLFNGFMGKVITDANVDQEAEEQLMEMMDIPMGDFPGYLENLMKDWPEPFKKLKLSTLMDIVLNMMDEEDLAELKKRCEEEDEG